MAARDCIVFLTHRWDASLAAHYARLQREVGALADVRLVYHCPNADSPIPAGAQPDVVVTTDDVTALFPRRIAAHQERWFFFCTELIWITAALKPELASYQHLWVLEYDVDFSGHWGQLFGEMIDYEGDLLGIDLRRASDEPGWAHLPGFVAPRNAPADPLLGFFPFLRASRRLVELYHRHAEAEAWIGHFELVLPSFAEAHGLTNSELGGDSAFTPSARRGRHYTTARMVRASRATFVFRPPRARRYFAEAPADFRSRDSLYHPVKTELSPAEFRRLSRRQRLVDWRNAIYERLGLRPPHPARRST